MSNSIPLVNPNVANAKRRGGPRPKSVNTPSGTTSKTFKWVEPLTEPLEVDFPFNFQPSRDYAVKFETDYLLPDTISAPYEEALDGLMFRTNQREDLKEDLKAGLKGQSFFKCARKLYGTLPDASKSRLQPLKSIWYDGASLPTTMTRLIDVVGDFPSQLGHCGHKFPETTFLRWVATGLIRSQTLSEVADPGENDGFPHEWIWPNEESIELIRLRAEEKMSSMRTITHELNIGGTKLTASLPEYSGAAHVEAFPEDVRRVWLRSGLCSKITVDNLKTNRTPVGTDPAIDLTSLLQSIGLAKAPNRFSVSELKVAFNVFQRNYSRRARPHLSAYFNLSESPHGDTGYAAQLIRSEEFNISSPFPQSDADLACGFILNPLKSIEIDPNFITYTRKGRSNVSANVASKSLTSLDH
jgi:hypothetical protein